MTTIETTRYINTHGFAPKGTGHWGFIGPEGQMAWAPMNLTLTAAKNWLKKELRILGLAGRYSTWQVAP
jgi:hypothetical protein